MFDRKSILLTCAALASLTAAAFAQQPPTTAKPAAPPQTTTAAAGSSEVPEGGMPAWIKPETPEHRRDRLGTAEDPGINPDPNKHWWRYGQEFTIARNERKWAAYDRGDGMVRPFAMVNFAYEIYQQNDRFVWVWMPVEPTPAANVPGAEAPPPSSKYLEGDIKFFEKTRLQFTPLTPAANNTVIRFEESSDGLPAQGS